MSNGNGNGGETNTENNDGKGGSDKGGGGVVGFLLRIAASAAASAITAIGGKLFGDRSVIVTVANNTAKPLKKIADHHESGGFASDPKPEIPASSSDSFGSQSTSPVEGAIGSVTYAGDGISLLVGWNNPRIGSNSTNHTLDGINKSRYLVVRQTGSGDSKAQMLYAIGIHPDYQVKPSLAQRGQPDLSRGIQAAASALGKGGRPISIRELVDF
jgi:hypothetical protein